jgi:hypothetical protein
MPCLAASVTQGLVLAFSSNVSRLLAVPANSFRSAFCCKVPVKSYIQRRVMVQRYYYFPTEFTYRTKKIAKRDKHADPPEKERQVYKYIKRVLK